MRIAEVAPVWERVPPVRYGGIELVVSLLTDELVRRGHKVTLFASGNSITEAELSAVYPSARRADIGAIPIDLLHVSRAFKRADEFDVVHNHSGYSGVALAACVDVPTLTTLHGIFTEQNTPFFEAFANACWYNSISDEQRRGGPPLRYIDTIYNAIDVSAYPFEPDKDDYLVSIGRISPLKGTHIACEMAERAGARLILAGKIDSGADTTYFQDRVAPFLDEDRIAYVGEVSHEEKLRLFARARGFLFPLQWAEPFGLVMVEALACGTPVLSLARGSVPEVVTDGVTGVVAADEDELASRIDEAGDIDAAACRAEAESRFSVGRMTDDYLAAFERIAGAA